MPPPAPRPWITVSAPAPLPQADDARSGAARDLDRIHDHVLRVVGDEELAGRIVADVATRAAARADELGEAPTFERLVELAHARMAVVDRKQPADHVVARLAGEREPGGAALVRACAVPSRRGIALLDLTTRHDVQLRRAASLLGIGRAAAGARTEALRQVRAQLADQSTRDVESTLARLPVVGAPAHVHRLVDLADVDPSSARVPTPLAWLGTAAAVTLTIAGLTVGLPRLVAADTGDGAPVAIAEEVTDSPAARQLATPGDDVPEGGVQEVVVREPATEPIAPSSEETTQTPAPEPSEDPAPTEGPTTTEDTPEDTEPGDAGSSPEPSPEPSSRPLDLPLPTEGP